MARRDLLSLLATFADVYPYVKLYRIGTADLVLLGADTPIPLDVANVDDYVSRARPSSRWNF